MFKMEYHVTINGSDQAAGTAAAPFRTINHAAQLAVAGDTVIVHAGTYREWVDPKFGGDSSQHRITYRAAPDERPIIKGSEVITGWQKVSGNVYQATVSNNLFGNYNPFKTVMQGDWMTSNQKRITHLGSLYVDGQCYYEAESLDALQHASPRTKAYDYMSSTDVEEPFPDATAHQWFAEVSPAETHIYANFPEGEPNAKLCEISVRPAAFYPRRTGRNYITVQGFEMAQVADPWDPPTVDQIAMLGPHWAKGWLIADNVLHDAKTCGISLGKDYTTGDEHGPLRPGYQYQLEAVFAAREYAGWDKSRIGSHQVLRNEIYNCGQAGIVGHMGAVFSTIADNDIHHIGLMREFGGWEMAGIKLHAAIDVRLIHNRIHDTLLAIWLDWQAQGIRVSRNLMYHNHSGLYVEVNHGPYLVDNNIIIGERVVDNLSQGGAFVHNFFAGAYGHEPVLDRFTPYHQPHSTAVKGFAAIYGGDDRFFRNIFAFNDEAKKEEQGTVQLSGLPESIADFSARVKKDHDWPADLVGYEKVTQPIYLADNAYLGGTEPAKQEQQPLVSATPVKVGITEEKDGVYVTLDVPEALTKHDLAVLDTTALPPVQIANADFEAPDGSVIRFDHDYDNKAGAHRLIGPWQQLHSGENRIKVWD